MRHLLLGVIVLAFSTVQLLAAGFDDFYELGPDSLVQDGVPQGTIFSAELR